MRNFPCADKHQQQVWCRNERERLTASASIPSQASWPIRLMCQFSYSVGLLVDAIRYSVELLCRPSRMASNRKFGLPASRLLGFNLTVDEAGETVTVVGQLRRAAHQQYASHGLLRSSGVVGRKTGFRRAPE
jgi:hypothetical protein